MDNILIELDNSKEPYIKMITTDKIINLTGESGSGKSFYAKQYINDNDYIVVDTDEVFARFNTSNGINKELGIFFRNKYKELPSLFEDFDKIYLDIIDYFTKTEKTIIIDSAQFRNMKDLSLLRGQIIVMRTSINTCYERCINRWNMNHPLATKEEQEAYAEKKKKMYNWYKSLNNFLIEVDKL